MATQTVPHVVSFPKVVSPKISTKVERISQEELGLLLSLRAQLIRIQSQVTTAEESLRTRLQASAIVQPGDHVVELKERSRRSVPWKKVVVRLANRFKLDGELYAARVLAATKPTKTVSLEVR